MTCITNDHEAVFRQVQKGLLALRRGAPLPNPIKGHFSFSVETFQLRLFPHFFQERLPALHSEPINFFNRTTFENLSWIDLCQSKAYAIIHQIILTFLKGFLKFSIKNLSLWCISCLDKWILISKNSKFFEWQFNPLCWQASLLEPSSCHDLMMSLWELNE